MTHALPLGREIVVHGRAPAEDKMRGEEIPKNNQSNIGKRDRAENQQMPVNIARRDALIAGQGFLNVIVKRPVPRIDDHRYLNGGVGQKNQKRTANDRPYRPCMRLQTMPCEGEQGGRRRVINIEPDIFRREEMLYPNYHFAGGVFAGKTQQRAEVGGKPIPAPNTHKGPDNHGREKETREWKKR